MNFRLVSTAHYGIYVIGTSFGLNIDGGEKRTSLRHKETIVLMMHSKVLSSKVRLNGKKPVGGRAMKSLKNRLLIIVTTLALLLSYALPFGAPVFAVDNGDAPTDADFTLTIMHVNDTHARVEQFPYLKTAVDEVRIENPDSLLLHAGDVFSGTLYFTVHKGQADLDFMNQLGFDAMTFGNHEFDKGSEVLADFVREAAFPFVSANIDFFEDALLGPLSSDEISETFENGKIYPAIIKEINGEKVGIFGLTTEDTPIIASPSEETKFLDAVEMANEIIDYFVDQEINKIIAISHLGYQEDLLLAKLVEGIDVIVGGHSHTELPTGVLVENDEPTVIVQAGENLNNLGVLDVGFNEEGVITNYSAELINLSKKEKDSGFQDLVDYYYQDIEELLKEEVGKTDVFLDGERENVRTKETNLGNLIADGMVWKLQQFIPDVTIALQNGGGIRASIEKGPITMGDVRTVLPFDNALVALEVTGEELLRALEHSVRLYPEQNGGFLQVSGIKFAFDPDKEPGNRVHSVKVRNTNGEYEDLDLYKMYTIATNSFTAKGGDGFESFKEAYEDGRMTNIDVPDYEVFSEYLEKIGTVNIDVEGRIVVAKADDETPPAEDPSDENGQDDGSNDEDGTKDEDGQKLPATATNNWTLLAIGLSITVITLLLYLYIQKARPKMNE